VCITALQDGGTITATASGLHIIYSPSQMDGCFQTSLWNQQFYHLSNTCC